MPLPMVHLAVAIQLYEAQGHWPSPAFLLGSIAPDAIHMRPDTDRSDKRHTHLLDSPDTDQFDHVRAMLRPYWQAGDTSLDFAEGYAAHLLTDRLWVRQVLPLFRQRLPIGLSDDDRKSLYYLEMDQIDFDIYHKAAWRRQVWESLTTAPASDFADLLTGSEIGLWRKRTLDWFGVLKQEPMITPIYLTEADIQAFISQAAKAIGVHFRVWRAMVDHSDRPDVTDGID